MFSILSRIRDAPSILSRLSLSIVFSLPNDVLNLVRRRVTLRVPFALQGLILLLNRFRRLFACAHPGRAIPPDQVSRAVGGGQDFEQIPMVTPLRVVDDPSQLLV